MERQSKHPEKKKEKAITASEIRSFVKEQTSTKTAARKFLLKTGIYTAGGKLKKEYA